MPNSATLVKTASEDPKDLREPNQENLREEISLIGPQGEFIAVHEADNVSTSLVEAPRVQLKPLRLISELPSLAPATMPRPADRPMAPGIGGYNIELPRPPIHRILKLDFENQLASQPAAPSKQTSTPLWTSAASFIVNLLMVGGFMLAVFLVAAPNLLSELSPSTTPPHQDARAIHSPARLLIEHQQGTVNEPLPLGIVLKDGTGEEAVKIGGLVNGTELSLGSSLGLVAWIVSAAEIDKTFVGPPKDFVGLMDVTVDLLSARGQLMDRQVLRLEWIGKDGIDAPAASP
jgi:hypothetical protein